MVAPPPQPGEFDAVDEDAEAPPEMGFSGRRLALAALAVAATFAVLYLFVPRLAGLDDTWNRLKEGDVWWLALAAALEVASYASYVALFRAVFARDNPRLGMRESSEITMAGVAATRLFAAGGAGGVVLTAWALRRSGMEPRTVASRMTAFLVLLYAVYMAALVLGGLGLDSGLLPGRAPFGLTVIPALFGGVAIVVALMMGWLGGPLGAGVRDAIGLLRTRDPRLLGAIGWWAFDIAVLWSCLRAFGVAAPVAPVVVAYFVGMLGNLLPLPGGVGGVDGGMIGSLIAFGIPGGAALVGVLSYRAFAFWLPTVPGAIAYVQLLRTVREWRRDGVRPPPRRRALRRLLPRG